MPEEAVAAETAADEGALEESTADEGPLEEATADEGVPETANAADDPTHGRRRFCPVSLYKLFLQ